MKLTLKMKRAMARSCLMIVEVQITAIRAIRSGALTISNQGVQVNRILPITHNHLKAASNRIIIRFDQKYYNF